MMKGSGYKAGNTTTQTGPLGRKLRRTAGFHKETFMRVVRLVVFLVLCASLACAQTFRGGIQGTVTDQTDAALPGVIVTATSVDTGLSRSVDTGASGRDLFSGL